jgi:hypothetical protein
VLCQEQYSWKIKKHLSNFMQLSHIIGCRLEARDLGLGAQQWLPALGSSSRVVRPPAKTHALPDETPTFSAKNS